MKPDRIFNTKFNLLEYTMRKFGLRFFWKKGRKRELQMAYATPTFELVFPTHPNYT